MSDEPTSDTTTPPNTPQQIFSSCYPVPTADYHQVAQHPDLFWDSLRAFHSSFGTKYSVPTIGRKALDLHHFFVEVTSRGGLEKVIRDRKWKEVIMTFNFPSTITSASFVLRKYYLSLLYHFEQVYYFRKQVPPISATESIRMQFGCSVSGTIDGKFDNGYLVTMTLGSEILTGVLYHTPSAGHKSQTSNTSIVPRPRKRKRSRMELPDPSHPQLDSCYNLFFSEQYARLKHLYSGKEKAINKKIALLWSKLSESEKEAYQEKGSRDMDIYESEMLDYKSVDHSYPQ